jgi:hypothetical protein
MAEQDIWKSMIPVEKGRPKGLLYHYTTSEGLLGIIERNHLWATHIRYLNDKSEFQHAFDRLYTDVFVTSFLPGADEVAKVGIPNVMASVMNKTESFLIAFTDDESAHPENCSVPGDRLSQWRSYSRGSVGYCLGFDYDCLYEGWAECSLKRAGGSLWVQRCIYSAAEKAKAAEFVGSEGLKRLFASKEASVLKFVHENQREPTEQESQIIRDQCISQAVSATTAAYPFHASRLKHEAFCEECEWRHVFHVEREKLIESHRADPGRQIVHFRSGLFGVTPYIEYPLLLATDKSPLRRIVVGPCPHPIEAARALELLLAANGIRGVEIAKSEIPYRDW